MKESDKLQQTNDQSHWRSVQDHFRKMNQDKTDEGVTNMLIFGSLGDYWTVSDEADAREKTRV